MDQGQVTLRYATAVAIILAVTAMAASAFAESGQYQPPAVPVDPHARLPGVIQFEQFLNKKGITGLNNVKGAPSPAPAQPAQAPAPAPPTDQPIPVSPAVQAAQPVQPAPEPLAPTPAPEPVAFTAPAPPVSAEPAPAPDREAPPPGSAQIPASSSASEPPAAETAIPVAAPAQAAAILYAPPLQPPWWERLLSSREFLYAAGFCLLFVPAAGFAASTIIGRRREERDLALYD